MEEASDSLAGALSFLGRRFLSELLGLSLFFAAVAILSVLILDDQQRDYSWLFFSLLIMVPRIVAALSRVFTAPSKPELRLLDLGDDQAIWLHRQLITLAVLTSFATFAVEFNVLNGVPLGGSRLGFWLNLLVHAYIIYIAWKGRSALIRMVQGAKGEVAPSDITFSNWYPSFTMIVAFATWLLVNVISSFGRFDLLTNGAHYTTMMVLILAPLVDTSVRGVVHHVVPPLRGRGPLAERAYEETKRSYIRIGRVIIFVGMLLLIAQAWQIDLVGFAGTGIGESVARGIIDFMMVGAIGYLVFELVSLAINRKLAAEQTAAGADQEDAAEGEGGGAGSSRLSTILPLLRTTAQSVVAVLFALLALGQAGIDTTPLLAGAGIAGLAIGFGAQKLVSDVVSGLFFLVDDAFRTGEYVEIDSIMGTVEKISIRSMQLRHHLGAVHTIPYGEIPRITNYSRDWVILKLKFTVDFDSDPNKIKKIFKRIGSEMAVDPLYKDDFIEPFKSQGVFDFSEVGMVVRGKFMTKPGKQFTIRKEIFNRVKAAFDEQGITFARREVRVSMPPGLEAAATDDVKEAVAAAASEGAVPPDSQPA